MQYTSPADRLAALYALRFGSLPSEVTAVTAAGSPRYYARLSAPGAPEVIGTVGTDLAENRAFFSIGRQLACRGINVPRVLCVDDDEMAYLQTDVGRLALFDILTQARDNGTADRADSLLAEAMRLLAAIHTTGSEGFDFGACFPQPAFDERCVRFDLNYFKYCFLKVADIGFDEIALQDDFDRLESILLDGSGESSSLMLRDFQSRNVMVGPDGHTLSVIDFQGARRGPREYDLASFLWQAKARFTPSTRTRLIETYLASLAALDPTADCAAITGRLPYFVLFRTMQTLGAYGFRGIIQQRPHFLASIDNGKQNLNGLFADNPAFTAMFPEIYRIASTMISSDQ